MRRAVFISFPCVLAAGLLVWFLMPDKPIPVGEPTPAPSGEVWVNLLEGEHAERWANLTNDAEFFTIEDGMMHIIGRPTGYFSPIRYVGYPEVFGDFELHLEFKVEPWGNSGVFLRNQPERRGFEIQVEDDHGYAPDKNSCGGVYDVVSPMYNLSRPAGEWNSFEISLRGSKLSVVMNGWLVVQADLSQMTEPIGKYPPMAELPLSGTIMLQDHGTDTWYRNLLIKPVES